VDGDRPAGARAARTRWDRGRPRARPDRRGDGQPSCYCPGAAGQLAEKTGRGAVARDGKGGRGRRGGGIPRRP